MALVLGSVLALELALAPACLGPPLHTLEDLLSHPAPRWRWLHCPASDNHHLAKRKSAHTLELMHTAPDIHLPRAQHFVLGHPYLVVNSGYLSQSTPRLLLEVLGSVGAVAVMLA